ncbi:TetR/AcrR family transcriptional regulator [Actinomadura barringtoniae]|uniref:TetR/AcrR family transcriptional regulator n=1 Tax=Actinomadura barringtoniae TaxID=1427535 RepID=A0A939PB16_9ACTN|nr:TetR/AcrR family transcriptional regulator [Actinomadura barringtoniae]MBO2446309.1 TetR/AcrR family transcriptional regulator [Actinomadura barringtoniae]
MADAVPDNSRRYRGLNAGQRQSARRGQLLAAGLELFGTAGQSAVSVKQVCRQAGLTERYFYESFKDREDLLRAVFEEQIRVVREATFGAVGGAANDIEAQARAGMNAFIRAVAGDPRIARVIFLEVVGVSPALEERRRRAIHEFAHFNAELAAGHLGIEATRRLRMGALALSGGIIEVMVDWTLGYREATLDEIVDLLTTLFMAAYRQFASEVG